MTAEAVWSPSAEQAAATNVGRFMATHGIERFEDLVVRSVDDPAWFWDAVVNFLGIPFSEPYSAVLDESQGVPWATWFTEGRLNAAHVCVDRHAETRPDHPAVVWEGEAGDVRRWTYADLRAEVDGLARLLKDRGIVAGDGVGIFMPMVPETVAAVLAVVKIGAVFLPLFSGYGASAIASRLTDADARAIVTAEAANRRGKRVDMLGTALAAADEVAGLHTVVVVPVAGGDGAAPDPAGSDPSATAEAPLAEAGVTTAEATGTGTTGTGGGSADERLVPWPAPSPEPLEALAVDSEHTLFVAYTSGTTGRPKGSVHVHGGFTVKVAEEVAFQFDCRPDDTLFWFTDMGWIMGPWEVFGALANGATLALFEGAPDWPRPDRLWEFLARHRVTILGISPTLIRALMPHGDEHVRAHDLSALRILGSTGEPWNADPWQWFFEVVGGSRCPVINISGGTEVGACFLSPHPVEPLKPMSLGGPSLGMAVDVYDDDGRPVRGVVGELVCTRPWPGMTRGLFHDPERYLETYWHRWPEVWVHGDWASVDDEGSWFLHGRSDDTIKVAGKRLGPAEVESALVSHPAVVEAAAVGVPDEVKGEALWCFVVLGAGADESEPLRAELKALVAEKLGKSFAPSQVRFTSALPKTRNAKVLRRAVRAVVVGADLGDLSSLEDPATVQAVADAR